MSYLTGDKNYPFRDEWAVRSHYWKYAPECDALRCLVKSVLMNPLSAQWTVQGFGMLRTYLPFTPNPKRFRLNVWNADLAVLGVSTIHDHPWDFTSWIINGAFRNIRFTEDHFSGDPFKFMTIKCGEDGCAMSDPSMVRLRAFPTEHYVAGDIYHQAANEVHTSDYDQGTVTLNDRVGDTEHARVFWADEPKGYWVDAKPRPATGGEVIRTTNLALQGWQDEIQH
jgi:hypothetical protein